MTTFEPPPDLAFPRHDTADTPAGARVSLDRTGVFERLVSWAARRLYGKVLDPLRASFHHRGVLVTSLALEGTVSGWRKLPPTLRALAVMGSAREIGCSWCMDFGYWQSRHRGVDAGKLRDVGQWRTSTVYSPLERAVLEYAVAATATPSAVTDELVARLREDLTEAQVVELAALVSLENYRSRTNAGLGLSSQGFKDSCDLPSNQAS